MKYVPGSSIADVKALSVDVIDSYKVAKPFVERHHYSGSFCAARASMGLFRNGKGGRPELVGACVFSVPVNNSSVPKHTGLTNPNQGCDLGRLVLLDDVGGNGETFTIARSISLLRQVKPEIISIVSYADPVMRLGPDGEVIQPGHIGTIYRGSAIYRGRTKPRTIYLTPDGQIFSERAMSKIRSMETGHGYAVDELVRRGAPSPANDNLADWLGRLKANGFLTGTKHSGNHIYNFPLTRSAKIAQKGLISLPYPILDRDPQGHDVTALPLMASL